MNTESMYTALGITPAVHRFGEEVLAGLRARFDEIDRVAEYNQCKVIGAMQKNRVDATHFAATTGYGYNDAGRDNLERGLRVEAVGIDALEIRMAVRIY